MKTFLSILFGAVILSGCSVRHVREYEPKRRQRKPVTTEMVKTQPPIVGSLWSPRGSGGTLFTDVRAFVTNDIVTIHIKEIASARRDANTALDRKANMELNADVLRLVHGEQDMRFHHAIRPWDLLAARASVATIQDKSSGQLVEVHQRLMRDGEIVCEATSGYFIRGPKKAGEKKREPAETPERSWLFESTYTVDGDQSYRYAEASLDRNPIHIDDAIAKAAGHPGVICHGLCTMAMATRELVDRLAGADPTRLKRVKVRFSRIVLPGDQLTTRAWSVDEREGVRTVGFECLNQRGERVLTNAFAEIAS